jgi:hypothetical protein
MQGLGRLLGRLLGPEARPLVQTVSGRRHGLFQIAFGLSEPVFCAIRHVPASTISHVPSGRELSD